MRAGRRRAPAGRGTLGKIPVVGLRDRATNRIRAGSVERADGPTLRGVVEACTAADAKVHTDDAAGYQGMGRDHEAVNHGAGEYVRGAASTNGIESFRALLKRGHHGVLHPIGARHLDRYVAEFAGRHNSRGLDTIGMVANPARGMVGKRLPYGELVA